VPYDTVIKLIQPGTFNDQLTDVLRNGARALLAQAVEARLMLDALFGTYGERRVFCQDPGVNVGDIECATFLLRRGGSLTRASIALNPRITGGSYFEWFKIARYYPPPRSAREVGWTQGCRQVPYRVRFARTSRFSK
jgi:hypothetical protein